MSNYVRLNDRQCYLDPIIGNRYTIKKKSIVYDVDKNINIELDKGSTFKLMAYLESKTCCCFTWKPKNTRVLHMVIEYNDIKYPSQMQIITYDYYRSDILIEDNGFFNQELVRPG